jgi:polyhydroxybutyrate depolymerase
VPDRPTARRAGARRALPAVLAGLAVLAAGCGLAPSQAATPDPAALEPRTVQLEVDGREREYLLQPATGLGQGEQAALVVVLHQEGATLESVTSDIELQALRAQGATLAYPAGIDESWDAGNCCGVPSQQKINDVPFVDAVLDDVARHTPVDPERRALVGYSSGGMLTYRYVCARPGRVAAAVVVSGSLESPCDGQISTPDVLAVHGTDDGTIGLDEAIFVKRLGLAPRPATSTLATFTRSAGCSDATSSRSAEGELRLWEGCRGGSVTALLVPGAGHAWDGLDASRRTEDFLRGRLLQR